MEAYPWDRLFWEKSKKRAFILGMVIKLIKNGRDIIDYQGTLTGRINIKYISEESDVKYEDVI